MGFMLGLFVCGALCGAFCGAFCGASVVLLPVTENILEGGASVNVSAWQDAVWTAGALSGLGPPGSQIRVHRRSSSPTLVSASTTMDAMVLALPTNLPGATYATPLCLAAGAAGTVFTQRILPSGGG